jgi:hypothetical protein
MKMLEDLEEVVRRAAYADSCTDRLETFNALDSESNAAANFIRTHHATIRDMAARLEAAERDAARYLWLRDADFTTDGILEIMWDTRDHEHLTGAALDAAIDAAMQETGR